MLYLSSMIILDVETTGTNAEKHGLVSIGAVDFLYPEVQFYKECRVWDGAHVDPRALEINGFSESDIKNSEKQSEGELVKNFLMWLEEREDMVIAGMNVTFDVDFVREASRRAGLATAFSYRIVDLHSIAYFHIINRGLEPPISNRKTNLDSDKIMQYVGIPTEPKPHNGLNGAIWEAEAFSRLMYNKSLLPNFFKYPIPFSI